MLIPQAPSPTPPPRSPKASQLTREGGDLFRIWSFLGSKPLQILPGAFPEEKRFLEQFKGVWSYLALFVANVQGD